MERDDEHKTWIWKREPERERPEKDEDGRATARDVVVVEEIPGSEEVSPLVSLWRSALAAAEGASARAHELKEHELDELQVLQLAWRDPKADDGVPN